MSCGYKNIQNSASFICDIYNSDGTPFAGCPRSNLKRLIKEALENGYRMNIGPEIEFFLFKTDDNNNIVKIKDETTGYYDTNKSNKYDEALIDETGRDILYDYQKQIQGFIDSPYYQMIQQASHIYKEKPFSYYDETLQQIIHGR